MYKRKRTSSSSAYAGSGSNSRLRAAAIGAKMRARFPYKEYGTIHAVRGGPFTREHFGESYKAATAEQRALRKSAGYYGRGKYSFGKFMRGAESAINSPLGRAVGGMAVSALTGRGLYSGRGSYTESNNLVDGSRAQIQNISGSTDETGSVCVSHREYIGDLFGPGTAGSPAQSFANIAYDLNPGLMSTFPWLSQIAANYDEYEFVQLLFEYRSTTTDIGSSTTGQCGTIVMCTNYNSAQPAFADKETMLQYAHAYSGKTTEHLVHGVECDPAKNALSRNLYTRSAPVVDQDLKTYDHGKFQVAICNSPAQYNGQVLGELWCVYKVILRKPKLYVNRGFLIDRDVFVNPSSLAKGLPANWVASQPLGHVAGYRPIYKGFYNNIGCQVQVRSPALKEIEVVFPDWYSGVVKITMSMKTVPKDDGTFAFTGNLVPLQPSDAGIGSGGTSQSPVFGGNVVPVNLLYGDLGNPTWYTASQVIALAGLTGSVDVNSVFTVAVSSSTAGVNNELRVTTNVSSVSTNAHVQLYVTIEEVNANGLQASGMPMVNSSGVRLAGSDV